MRDLESKKQERRGRGTVRNEKKEIKIKNINLRQFYVKSS